MTIPVRKATIGDAASLSELAARTFRETFESENTPENMSQFLAETYSPEKQAAEINDPNSTILVAESYDGPELIGYAHLMVGQTPPAIAGPRPIELKRLYVDREWHGAKVAQALMDAAISAAKARGARTIWLGVWERNSRAIAFYNKYGFTHEGEHTFVVGTDPQTDLLLSRGL